MPTITQTVEIDRPAADVEAVYTSWNKYPEFIPFIKEVNAKGDHQLETKLRIAGMNFGYTAEVSKHGDMKWSWETVEGDINHSGTATIEPISSDRTRLTMIVNYDVPGPELAGRITNWLGLVDTGIRSSMENFRAYVENQ